MGCGIDDAHLEWHRNRFLLEWLQRKMLLQRPAPVLRKVNGRNKERSQVHERPLPMRSTDRNGSKAPTDEQRPNGWCQVAADLRRSTLIFRRWPPPFPCVAVRLPPPTRDSELPNELPRPRGDPSFFSLRPYVRSVPAPAPHRRSHLLRKSDRGACPRCSLRRNCQRQPGALQRRARQYERARRTRRIIPSARAWRSRTAPDLR